MVPEKVDERGIDPVMCDPGRVEQGNGQGVGRVHVEPEDMVRSSIPPEQTIRACHERGDDVERVLRQRVPDEPRERKTERVAVIGPCTPSARIFVFENVV